MMREWKKGLWDVLFPVAELPGMMSGLGDRWCERCGEPYEGEMPEIFRCSNCAGRRWHISRARAAYRAEGAVRELIHEFKYNKEFHHLPQLTSWLEEGFERFYAEESWDALVPVPLYPLRKREREFNQAEELARMLGRRRGLSVWKVLERVKKTETQAKLRRSERLRNQKGAFCVKSGFDLKGRRLLIIDDVFTTGATVDACAQVLHQAGAEHLAVLTVARG
ncbi:MAG: ComF family protein [Blastochloris sp.]|nr:ComF family protein [Blastochloris sp.]